MDHPIKESTKNWPQASTSLHATGGKENVWERERRAAVGIRQRRKGTKVGMFGYHLRIIPSMWSDRLCSRDSPVLSSFIHNFARAIFSTCYCTAAVFPSQGCSFCDIQPVLRADT